MAITMAIPIINNIANITAITEPRISAAIKTAIATVARATPVQNLLMRPQKPDGWIGVPGICRLERII